VTDADRVICHQRQSFDHHPLHSIGIVAGAFSPLAGIVQEIANAATLSDGEKVALVESVLNAYAPVQEAKAAQDTTATDTLDEAVSAATNVSVAPVYPDETEAEEVVSFA